MSNKKTKTVRFEPDEADELVDFADELGLSQSDVIRDAVSKYINSAKDTDEPTLTDVHETSQRILTVLDDTEVNAATGGVDTGPDPLSADEITRRLKKQSKSTIDIMEHDPEAGGIASLYIAELEDRELQTAAINLFLFTYLQLKEKPHKLFSARIREYAKQRGLLESKPHIDIETLVFPILRRLWKIGWLKLRRANGTELIIIRP